MPIRVKDHSKCNEWERRRRDRLNDAFKNLAELLPHYDPSRIPAKIEILEKSTEFVKELRLSNSRLLSNQVETDEKCKLIKQLQDEVNRLILRVKQLTVLLKKASITIPIGPEIKSLGSKRMKWSGKLKPEDVENAVISDGTTTPSGETVPAAGKVSTILLEAVSNQTSNLTSQPSNDIITNSSAINTSVASIIVPLKETNLSNTNGCDNANSKACAISYISPITVTSASAPVPTSGPTKVTFTSVMTTCSSQSSPIKMITTSKPIFTTATSTPIQLPLQTFIFAPCPITSSTQALPSQNPQLVTRIANILSSPIVPKTIDGLPCFKVPIKSLLKPIPKVIRRRKRKKKNETLTPSPTNKNLSKLATEEVQPHKEKIPKDDATSNENVSSTATKPVSSPTDNKTKEITEPEVQPLTTSANVDTENENDNEEKIGEKDSSIKNIKENELPDSETSDLVTSNEISPTLSTSGTASSIVAKELQDTKVIDISEDVEVVVEKTGSFTEKIAIVSEGSKTKDCVSEKKDKSENKLADNEMQECDNIPVLRIIEASDEGGVVHDNILSTVVIESSNTETLAEKEAVDHNMSQSKLMKEKEISEESIQLSHDKILTEETSKTSSNADKADRHDEPSSIKRGNEDETEKSVCEIPTEGSAKNSESGLDTQNRDDIEKVPPPDLIKEKISNQKDKVAQENSSLEIPHQKDAGILDKDKSCTMHASVQITCHNNMDSICDASNSYPVAGTSITPAKDNVISTSSKEISVTFSQKPVELRPLQPLTQLPEKVFHDVTSLTPTSSISKQREESEKTKATSSHKAIMENTETVPTDKISECIARSIDLIDANDSELMALGEHWEDSGASPKSISPTQIFLNIFPLLPRESSINEQHHSQTTHQLTQNPPTTTFQSTSRNILPFTPSSNSRSSFFIDAMLPDDHPTNTSTEITDPIHTPLPSSHSPFLPLTPPQYSSLAPTTQQISSPFSLSSNYYWTPQTIPSSSNADTNFMDYRNTSNINIFSLDENQRSCVSSSTISSSLASTLTPVVASVKSSTVPSVSTTSSVTAPILSTAASKTKSKSSESHSTSSNKRQKTESSGKLAFMVDTPLPTFSKDKKTKTSVTVTTATSTNVTWTGTSTSTTSSTLHVPTFQQNAAQNVSAVPTMDSIGHCSSTPVSSSSQKIPYHSCSLLDALNPMDASFFRPLINALDGHDFRSIDFPGGSSLPPPPLPPLIAPSSSKSLYSSHINPTPQPTQNPPMNTTSYSSHHQHHLMQPNQPIQMFSNNVPLTPSSKSHSEISSHSSKHQHHNKPMQQFQSVTISSQQESRPSTSSKPTKSQSTNVPSSATEKTSRTSGRQKHESKQGRSGKSSRTQPYVTQSSTLQTTVDQKQSQKQDHNAPNDTPKATRTHSFHTIHSHIHSSADLNSSSSRNYDFHSIPQSQPSTKVSHPVKVKPANSDKTAPTPRNQAPKPSESKTQKSKEQKAQSSHSSNQSKQPSRSTQSSFSIAQQLPSHSHASTSVPLKSTSSHVSAKAIPANQSELPHQTNFSRPNLHEIPKQVQLIQNTTSSVSQPIAQLQQSSGESINLFPDFSTIGTNCNTTRQLAGGQSHTPQYYYHDTSSMQQQQEQHPSVSNFPIQRTQPYYFPDISSFENFPAIHQNQGQPQHPLVTQQVHHPSVNRQAVPESSNNYVQNQSQSETHEPVNNSTKCTYGSNPSTVSTTNSNQPEFQHAHVQHQPTMRQHQNYFMHQDTYHSQQPSIQHHTTTLLQPSESQRHQPQFPTCQQQVQQQVQQQPSRNHAHHPHSNTSTATTSTTTSVSSGKEKPQHSTPAAPPLAFHPRATSQPQQPPHQQQVSHHLQQNLPQPTNRTSSKTVNWMTDTGYRSNSSTNAVTNKQQRQSTVGVASTSNPFSVSKLVGNTSVAVPSKVQQAPSSRNASSVANSGKNQQNQPIASHSINAPTHTTTTRQNKSSRNNTTSNSSTVGTGTTPAHSQNQSNYCAEALIRKNPPVAATTNDWMNDFNLVSSTNHNFHGSNYPDGHHSSSHSHTQHHQNQNTADNFSGSYPSNICGGTYHYQAGAASSTPSSNASHFPNFDQIQPNHRNHHHHQPQHPHAVQTSTSNNYDHGQQRVHNSPSHSSSQPHDMQINAASQMHYQHPHHHHHHQIHLSNQHPQTHSSSSSVTNFNLSTIFPEINDKRNTNNSSNSLGAQIQGGSTSSGNNSSSNAGGPGNIHSAFGYQHSSFGSSTEGPGHMR